MDWRLYATITAIALVDFVVLFRVKLHRRRRRKVRYRYWRGSDDFGVLIPIFGDIKYLRNADALQRYGDRIVICTTEAETPEFYSQLHAEARRRGFRVVIAPTSSAPVPSNQFAILSRSVLQRLPSETTRDRIVRNAAAMLQARTIIYLDGDTVPAQDLRVIVQAFEDSGLDIASVRVVPSKTQSLSERLQDIEYDIAMDARLLYPWLTSGAATIGRSESIRKVMANHSLFFSGGDIELGTLARRMGMKVGHLPFLFFTDVPESLRGWFRQRARGWCIGGFRLACVNPLSAGVRAPFFAFYQTFVVYGLLPFRWYEAVVRPHFLVIVWLVYSAALFALGPRTFKWWKLLFPIYAFAQVMIAVPIGVAFYARYAIRTRHLGRIRLRPEPILPPVIDLTEVLERLDVREGRTTQAIPETSLR